MLAADGDTEQRSATRRRFYLDNGARHGQGSAFVPIERPGESVF